MKCDRLLALIGDMNGILRIFFSIFFWRKRHVSNAQKVEFSIWTYLIPVFKWQKKAKRDFDSSKYTLQLQ